MAGAGEEGSLLGTWVGVERCEFCSEFCVLVLSAFVLCFLSNYGIIHTFMMFHASPPPFLPVFVLAMVLAIKRRGFLQPLSLKTLSEA